MKPTLLKRFIQEILRSFLNLKAHFRVYKNPPLVPVLNQVKPFPTLTPYVSKIHFNTILPSVTSRSEGLDWNQ